MGAKLGEEGAYLPVSGDTPGVNATLNTNGWTTKITHIEGDIRCGTLMVETSIWLIAVAGLEAIQMVSATFP